ncbi:hypothetical protein [Nocardiopsis sp. CC223A]|uniref:Kelch repeat-containing protein n=1 Tax=Nocardiopsis sp. CC223A TaxID=3044051 RepID=UPI00278C64D4|nr:hypothetical protein [Nocardiopsis sp. CC223A]
MPRTALPSALVLAAALAAGGCAAPVEPLDVTAEAGTDSPLPDRYGHTAVWTGELALLWGGGAFGDAAPGPQGAAYDPDTDTWTPLPDSPLDGTRRRHAAAWTGTELIVWGGMPDTEGPHYPADGARYDPGTGEWTPLAPAPSGRWNAVAAADREHLVVGGGQTAHGTATGIMVHDAAADTWSVVPTGTPVVDLALLPGGEAVVLLADAEETVLAAFDPDTGGAVATAHTWPGSGTHGLAVHDGTVHVTVGDGETVAVDTFDTDLEHRDTRELAADSFLPARAAHFAGDGAPGAGVTDDGVLVAVSPQGVSVLDTGTGRTGFAQSPRLVGHCAEGSSVVAGERVLLFGCGDHVGIVRPGGVSDR